MKFFWSLGGFGRILESMNGHRSIIISSLLFILAILVSCIPVGESNQQSFVPSLTASKTLHHTSTSTPTVQPSISETAPPSRTVTPIVLQTASQTVQPTQTRILVVSPTRFKLPRPTRTLTPTVSFTHTTSASPTMTETAPPTETAKPAPTVCPIATEELFSVEPVISPTDQLTQIIKVYIGNGEEVRIVTESGTFTMASGPFLVEIALLPNTVHHLEVFARVRQVISWDGCIYGGYTMSTTTDDTGAPLIIVQGLPTP